MYNYVSPEPKIGGTYGFFDKCILNRYNYFDSFVVTDTISLEGTKQIEYEDGETLYEKLSNIVDWNENEKNVFSGRCFEISDSPVFLHRNKYGEWVTVSCNKWPEVGVLDVDGCLCREMELNEMD